MVRFIDAAATFNNFVGFIGDDPTTEDEFLNLSAVPGRIPEGGVEECVWLGDAPSWEQIQTKIAELQAEEDTKVDAASTGNQKLLDLGLTQAEATALTGYTPPSE